MTLPLKGISDKVAFLTTLFSWVHNVLILEKPSSGEKSAEANHMPNVKTVPLLSSVYTRSQRGVKLFVH